MNRAECKRLAKEIMKKNWINAFLAILIYSCIAGALGSITGGIGIIVLGSMLLIALSNVFISAYHGHGYEVSHMLKEWDKGTSNRIALSALKYLYIFFWTLLFFIPGIVKTYSYCLAEYISRENPNKSAKECIDESRRLMDGHKMELFLLDLSFIGWYILSALTCGILYIWVLPYVYQTRVIFIDKNIYHLVDLENPEDRIIDATISHASATRYCSNCGRSVEDNEIYCPSCGTKIR